MQKTSCDKCEHWLAQNYKICPKCENRLVSVEEIERSAISGIIEIASFSQTHSTDHYNPQPMRNVGFNASVNSSYSFLNNNHQMSPQDNRPFDCNKNGLLWAWIRVAIMRKLRAELKVPLYYTGISELIAKWHPSFYRTISGGDETQRREARKKMALKVAKKMTMIKSRLIVCGVRLGVSAESEKPDDNGKLNVVSYHHRLIVFTEKDFEDEFACFRGKHWLKSNMSVANYSEAQYQLRELGSKNNMPVIENKIDVFDGCDRIFDLHSVVTRYSDLMETDLLRRSLDCAESEFLD